MKISPKTVGRVAAAWLGVFGMVRPASAGDSVGVYVGTYTEGSGSKGIYRFEFDEETGTPADLKLMAESENPSFLAFAPDGKHLYAANEVENFEGKPSGAVSAYAVDAKTGALKFLNQRPTGGGSPCHLVVDRGDKNVIAANYGGGSTAVLPIAADGMLGAPSAFLQHKGSGAEPGRQTAPHAHSVNLDASGKFAVVADLGLDKVFVYRLDPGAGTLVPNDPPFTAIAPGSGPRHFSFHPNGKYAYVINELNSTVTALTYNAARGTLRPLQTVSSVPAAYQGKNYPADVQVHPNGAFLYGSNRGHDSIAVYTIDPSTGELTFVETEAEGVKNPRNFAIDPTGKFLLVANQDANTVVVFAIDPKTGALKPTGHSLKAPKPVCLKFVPRAPAAAK